MAAISSNCLYLDRQDAKGGASGRTYEAFEVDKETRRRDCRICLYSLGLAIVVITLALLYLGVFSLDWMVEGDWASTFRCTSYMCLAVLMVVFIYCIAKVSAFEAQIKV